PLPPPPRRPLASRRGMTSSSGGPRNRSHVARTTESVDRSVLRRYARLPERFMDWRELWRRRLSEEPGPPPSAASPPISESTESGDAADIDFAEHDAVR